MYVASIAIALLLAFTQQGSRTPDQQAELAKAQALSRKYEQESIRINEMAGHITSEADARALVDAVAAMFQKELPPTWVTAEVRRQLARIEYGAATNSGLLIPEQRIVDVWNQYVREMGASDEALVTVAEIHNLRDQEYAGGKEMWDDGMMRSLWTMPNIYAVGHDGKVANGCRALETLRVLYDVDDIFENLRSARQRVQKGIVVSDEIRKRQEARQRYVDRRASRKVTAELTARLEDNPVRRAEQRYLKENGETAMNLLVLRLFGQLFPE